MIYFIFNDIYNLILIMSMYDGCKPKFEKEKSKTIAEESELYDEVRGVIIEMYKNIMNKINS